MTETCACGCGGTPRPGKKFLKGHYSRTPEAKEMYKNLRKPIDAPNPSGLCMCGCGKVTPLATSTRPTRGVVAGEHICYLPGHHTQKGPGNPSWRGGRWTHKGGYVYLYVPEHPAANRDGYVYEHRVIAEQTLGRYLAKNERVHHINGIKTDNRPDNLIVLTQSEHIALHGGPENLQRYRDEHPEASSLAGKKGAAIRWNKPMP